MKLKMEKAISIALAMTLLLSAMIMITPKVKAQATTVTFVPGTTDIYTEGEDFIVTCWINDVTNLAGYDIQIKWDTNHLTYINHTLINDCLISPTFETKNIVNTSDPIRYYWLASATLSGTGFDGSGAVFEMAFYGVNLPWSNNPAVNITTYIEFVDTALADVPADPIPHTATDGIVVLHAKPIIIPPVPMLVVDPPTYSAGAIGETFEISVILMGADSGPLDAYWDVAGIDVMMHFNTTLMEALGASIDPDGDFVAFWPGGLFNLTEPPEIDNVAGTVRVAFMGIPGTGGAHTAPNGFMKMFSVTFNATTESTSFPPPSAPITLQNPMAYTGEYVFGSMPGLIDITSPVGTAWTDVRGGYGTYTLASWTDNTDGELSTSDQFIMDGPGGYYFDYHIEDVTGLLNLTLARSLTTDLWVTNSMTNGGIGNWGLPGSTIVPTSGAAFNGYGLPNWTGNFTLAYPIASVNSITAHYLPFTGDEYTAVLTEGVDYAVHADDDLIEILLPLDVQIINEHWKDGVNNSLNGWPWINYMASSIQSVYVDFNNGTSRFGVNNGFQVPPPGEWWYEPDWPGELEGWWALGYFSGPFTWPAGSDWWVNYTACTVIDVDYNTDPYTVFAEYNGTYADFLTLTTPVNETFNEVFPMPFNSYTFEDFTDSDTSSSITVGDFMQSPGPAIFRVDGVHTGLRVARKPWICEDDPADEFFGVAPIVSIAGFPQPDMEFCPWHNYDFSVPLPHEVRNGEFISAFKSLGGFIDVYVCNYPEGFKGEGFQAPADMFWPQKEVMLCANVTYAGWPEQRKDVAFEVKDPHGVPWGIWYNRTDEYGMTFVRVRLPWPCDDPEYYFGVWKVWATVDVACVVVNDTMEFKYDYKVRIFNAETDKTEYKHCEDIHVTIYYGSQAMQLYPIVFTITAVDDSGVPFGFDYILVEVGGAEYCTYANGTVQLTVHVEKWARPTLGTIYIGALNGFPQDGGSAETPVFTITFGILAEWA
ncbi:MAG: hypothetical protein JSV64_06125 [Candidatus Bathyarchaeota archaeon]|nr:MAG: hypothetical protein JSV64_06125 [Candidatus Bathyarchaeota archaeon]